MKVRSVFLGALAVAALAACGSTSPSTTREPTQVSPAVITHFHDVPSAVVLRGCLTSGRQNISPIRCAAWAGPHTLDVVTLGSGTCPSIPTSVVVHPPAVITIKIVMRGLYPPSAICTADISPTTSVLHIPATIDSSRPVQVQNDGATIHVLPLGSAVVPDIRGAPSCTADQIRIVGITRVSPMTGEHGFVIIVTEGRPVGDSPGMKPCVLTGYPSVRLLDAKGALPFVYKDGGGPYLDESRGRTILLRSGADAQFEIVKYRCDLGTLRTATSAQVSWPGTSRIINVTPPGAGGAHMDYCVGGAHDPGQIVYLGPTEKATSTPPYDEEFR